MPWEVRPTIIVPVRAVPDPETGRSLVDDAYREASEAHDPPFVVLARGYDESSLRESWDLLRARVETIAEAGGDTFIGGSAGLEHFVIRFLFVFDGSDGSRDALWASLREACAGARALGLSCEGAVILIAPELAEEDEKAACELRRDFPFVPILVEERNPAGGHPVAPARVRDTALTIIDLLVNSASPHEQTLEPLLQGASLGRRIIPGAAVFDPGRDLLEAFRLAAVDANYPRALALLATAETMKEGSDVELANALAEKALEQISGELIRERGPTLPDHPNVSTDDLRFFSTQSSKKADYEDVERKLRNGLRDYASRMMQAGADVSERHREGLRGVPGWTARFLGSTIDRVRGAGNSGRLWPKDLHNVLGILVVEGGAGRLSTHCRDWIAKARATLTGKLRHRVGWTEWEQVREIRADRFLRPRWLAYVWPALAIIAMLLLRHYQQKIPLIRDYSLFPRLIVFTLLGALLYTVVCAFFFHRSKLKLRRDFSDRSDGIRRFFLANEHQQRLSFIEETVERAAARVGRFRGRLGAFLTYLRSFAEKTEAISVVDHERIRELAKAYSDEVVRKAIRLLELEPEDHRVEEIATSVSARLAKENLPDFVEDPDGFLVWVRDRVSEHFVEKRYLGDAGALQTAGMVESVFDRIERELRSNRPVPYYHKAGQSRGILFFPDGYAGWAEELSKRLSDRGEIALLPVRGRGRFGVLNFYEREIDHGT
ncbi:MAG: hypothetical protein ABIK65_13000 [Candidatus Eisenbacteria bacterium]